MNANTYTFGLELELQVPDSILRNQGMRIGAYHVGAQVPFLPNGWTAQRDASLQASPGYTPCEIVSPILRGAEGIDEVIRVLAKLNELGFRIAVGAGTHYAKNEIMLRDGTFSAKFYDGARNHST